MYKAAPPFSMHTNRREALAALRQQLGILEDMVDPEGPYLAGPAPTLADCAIFPTAVFIKYMLPKVLDQYGAGRGGRGHCG